ncbi:hypothetical protein [Pseudomarimonas arenosa]|uniref:Uncharacterized protein n=1 Tax=Pseudomarimonas arenosa TaxID=2774145 RepID=A0AAW3ZPI2_9GAMM|nr:hypothetical protein [Pseudomarimonas arenosa]MBD8527094.1 hypothetical protein [Pseudomarimonas arenosa]
MFTQAALNHDLALEQRTLSPSKGGALSPSKGAKPGQDINTHRAPATGFVDARFDSSASASPCPPTSLTHQFAEGAQA